MLSLAQALGPLASGDDISMEGIQARDEAGVSDKAPVEGAGQRITLLHGSAPPVFGLISGWVAHHVTLAGRFTLGLGDFDGLVFGCLLVAGLLCLLGIIIHPMSRIIDYIIGVSVVMLGVLGMIVIGRICGVSAALTMWAILSISWSNRSLPPFRIGLWHGLGGCTGVIVGSILASV